MSDTTVDHEGENFLFIPAVVLNKNVKNWAMIDFAQIPAAYP